MKKWVCLMGHKLDERPEDGLCPYDGSHVKEVEVEEQIIDEKFKEMEEEKFEEFKYEGDHGLGILIFDLSPSMDYNFLGEKSFTKLQIVSNAFASTIATLVAGDNPISKPNDYFISLIGFAGKAEHFGTFRLLDMNKGDFMETVKYWQDFIMKYPRPKLSNGTNITAALDIAHEIYSAALKGEINILKNYGFPDDFELGAQSISSKNNEVALIPNIRVFIYSDGVHNVGEFRNPFATESLWPGLRSAETFTPVNGVLSIFISSEDEEENKAGTETMKRIAGFCPIHNTIGFVPISDIKDYEILRGFIHMTSRASGFCLKCLEDWRSSRDR